MGEQERYVPASERPMPTWVGCAMVPLVVMAVLAALVVGWFVLAVLSP